MLDLRDGELIDMLRSTPFADDADIQCLSYALNQVIRTILDNADGAMIHAGIERVPENVLDALAVEEDVKWYDMTADVDVKQMLIRDSYMVHAKSGTRAAVNRVVSDYYGAGEISEWFEYGGDPGHFRISITSEDMHVVIPDAFVNLVNKVKRQSAILDGMDFTWSTYQKIYAGTAQYQSFRNADITVDTQ